MLFLLNNRVFEVGDVSETLKASGFPMAMQGRVKPAEVIQAGLEAFLANPDFPNSNPSQAAGYCALLMTIADANAALFIAPPGAKAPQQVGWRLADIPITTIARLFSLQTSNSLTPAVINREVWANAA
jgi:hypothetical protein